HHGGRLPIEGIAGPPDDRRHTRRAVLQVGDEPDAWVAGQQLVHQRRAATAGADQENVHGARRAPSRLVTQPCKNRPVDRRETRQTGPLAVRKLSSTGNPILATGLWGTPTVSSPGSAVA